MRDFSGKLKVSYNRGPYIKKRHRQVGQMCFNFSIIMSKECLLTLPFPNENVAHQKQENFPNRITVVNSQIYLTIWYFMSLCWI